MGVYCVCRYVFVYFLFQQDNDSINPTNNHLSPSPPSPSPPSPSSTPPPPPPPQSPGLYYLAEFVKEHTKTTKQIMNYTLYFAITLHILLLLFEDLPFFYVIFSLGCHFIYRPMLATYPYIDIFSPLFILSGVLAFCDHFLWFYYFAHYYAEPEVSYCCRWWWWW